MIQRIRVNNDTSGLEISVNDAAIGYFVPNIAMSTIMLCRETKLTKYGEVFREDIKNITYSELNNSYYGGNILTAQNMIRTNAEFLHNLVENICKTEDLNCLGYLYFTIKQSKPAWKLITVALEEAESFLKPIDEKSVTKTMVYTEYNERFSKIMEAHKPTDKL